MSTTFFNGAQSRNLSPREFFLGPTTPPPVGPKQHVIGFSAPSAMAWFFEAPWAFVTVPPSHNFSPSQVTVDCWPELWPIEKEKPEDVDVPTRPGLFVSAEHQIH